MDERRLLFGVLFGILLCGPLVSSAPAQKSLWERQSGVAATTCAFGVDPANLHPLPEGVPYVSATDTDQREYSTYLYPGDSNTIPGSHRQQGEAIAASIRPLNANGSIDENNGKIVVIAEGMSNTRDEMNAFAALLSDRAAEVNDKLVFENLSEGGCDLVCWSKKGAGAVDKQVQIAVLKHSNNRPQDSDGTPQDKVDPFTTRESKFFPSHALETKRELKTRILDLKKKYPNLKLVYLMSRTYGGWSCSPSGKQYREPVAYEEGFSVKWLIEDQINGADAELRFDGANAPAPWLAWGPYIWDPTWDRNMYRDDGTHPSEAGSARVAAMLFDFLSNNSTSASWFSKKVTTAVSDADQPPQDYALLPSFPNPFVDRTEIRAKIEAPAQVTISVFNVMGQKVRTLYNAPAAAGTLRVSWDGADTRGLLVPNGVYLLRLELPGRQLTRRLVLMR